VGRAVERGSASRWMLSTRLYYWHACVFVYDCAIINIITTILDPLRRRSVALRYLIGIL
jgi:hypothetical protein